MNVREPNLTNIGETANTDVTGLLIDHLDLWTGAITHKRSSGRGSNGKVELTGLKKLRELILELAVRGKLVDQDPSDEPASVLLERIAEEKARLVREGRIKKPKPLPEIEKYERKFSLPEAWEWTRFGTITFNRDSERIPLSVSDRSHRQGKYDYYGASGVIDKIDDYLFDKPLLLIGEDGANLINRSTPIAFMARGKYWVNNHAHVIDGISEGFLNYLCLYVNSISLEPYITGTAQPKMNQAKMNTISVGLPPIQEQQRIIEKVDELMAFCDRLEQQVGDQLEAHEVLVETLLNTLTLSADAAELAENWARVAEHFDTLFTTEASIDKLKLAVLDLAADGKLIEFHVDKRPLKSMLSFGPRNGLSPKESSSYTGFKVLKLGATTKGRLDLAESKDVDIDEPESSHLWLKSGDILIQRGNAASHVGCNIMIEKDQPDFIYPDLMMKIRVKEEVDPKFISSYLSAPQSRQFMWERMTGTSGTMPKISKKVVEAIPIALPDIETQQATVEKVDELMALCDMLKARLGEASETRTHLAEAVVEQAVS